MGFTRMKWAACFMLAGASVAQAQNGRGSSPDFGAFDRYVAQAAKDWHVPALAIAVVKNDSLVFAKGYGVLQIGTTTPANEHTRFAIGSTTKAMTSAALAMLVDEGKLRWDDRVVDLLPDFQLADPWVTREVTVRDLLTHRTGLPGTDMLWGRFTYTLPEMIHRLRYVKPSASFRSEWQYQNVVYAMGGELVARLSGMPWDQFIRTRIFAPLGMTESEALVSQIIGKPNVAIPHAEINDTVRVVPYGNTDAIAPAGSVYSSVVDMSKWMRFILDSGRVGDKRLIKPETFRELIAPEIRAPMEEYPALQLARPNFFSYALGWFVQDYGGQTVWMHTGSINGMCAIIGLMPNERVGVYVLENLDHAEVRHALMYKGFDLYNGRPQRDWSGEVRALFARRGTGRRQVAAARPEAKPTLPVERYAGTYVDSTYGTITVTAANGELSAQIGTEAAAPLDALQYDTFRTRSADMRRAAVLSFATDGAGNVTAVRLQGATFAKKRAERN